MAVGAAGPAAAQRACPAALAGRAGPEPAAGAYRFGRGAAAAEAPAFRAGRAAAGGAVGGLAGFAAGALLAAAGSPTEDYRAMAVRAMVGTTLLVPLGVRVGGGPRSRVGRALAASAALGAVAIAGFAGTQREAETTSLVLPLAQLAAAVLVGAAGR